MNLTAKRVVRVLIGCVVLLVAFVAGALSLELLQSAGAGSLRCMSTTKDADGYYRVAPADSGCTPPKICVRVDQDFLGDARVEADDCRGRRLDTD
jgi:hypothetical protein